MRKTFSLLLILACLSLALPAAARAQCPAGQFFLDLKSCVTAGLAGVSFLPGGNCVPVAASTGCSTVGNWKQAALKIAIPAGCTQANIVVEWEGLPCGYTLNLGDSPTNDAHAGDGGSTTNDAELWILNEILAVANNGAAPDNPVARQDLGLTDGAMKFVVRNQYVSWSQPYTVLQAPSSKQLFAVPDTTVAAADQRALYLGLNRVIAGSHRRGYGARRVLITFQ